MNFLYVHSHDTGRYVAPYGYAVPTPRISQFARDAAVFRNAFSAAPTCSPSRAALLTGEYPHQAGMIGLAHRGFSLTHPQRHLAWQLREAGYDTVLTGMQHVHIGDQSDVGYAQDLRPESLEVAHVVPVAEAWLRDRAADAGPFFLDVGFEETHRPYPAGQPADALVARAPAIQPDTPETRGDMADYWQSARQLDDGVGRLLDALDDTGLADDTIVILTTDHGIAFPGMKSTLSDHGLGVMLMIRGPESQGWQRGVVIEGMVSHMDVYPTLMSMLGLTDPAWLRGQSLLPMLRGEAEDGHAELFGEVTYHAAYEPMRSVRTDRWLYVKRFGGNTRRVMANVDDSPTREVLTSAGWQDMRMDEESLFDCLLDPEQRVNRIADPACADVRADLAHRLARWMAETDDPLLATGDVPLPDGAVINRVDAWSANDPAVTGDDGRMSV